MKRRAWMLAAAALLPLLYACGGGGDDDEDGDGSVRLVNATDGYASLDLYEDDDRLSSAVAADAAGSYSKLGSGTYTFKLKRNGSSTTSASTDRTVQGGTAHTLVAYTTADALRTVFLTDDDDQPDSGTAKLRFYNASTEAGALDIYVTAPDASLSDSTPYVSGLAAERIGSYIEFSNTTYRIRVTGSGDKADLRLDLPAVELTSRQIATLVLTSTPGGVLVHGLMINQKSEVIAAKNGSARLRLVAGAGSNGTVAATANGSTLSTGLRSPAVGSYALVNAGALTLDVKLDGTTLATDATSLIAGSDNTLLVSGPPGSATAKLLSDDNRPAISSANARLRLVHGIGAMASPITLTADYSAVASDVATNTASAPTSLVAATDVRLEVSSPTVTGALYLATDVTLQAAHVYTVFMLGDASAPVGVLRRDR